MIKYFPILYVKISSTLPVLTKYDFILSKYIVPIGISYYVLMAISYVVDVYYNRIRAEKNFLKVLLYLIFFPHIIEGPIGKFSKLTSTLFSGNTFLYSNFQYGLLMIIGGLVKKLIIADRLGIFVNQVLTKYNDYSGCIIFLACLCYTIQIYADFSGSINIVTGVARFFGVTLESNFERPFFSTNIQEFWRRWHITLGVWLRDYIFYPITMSNRLSSLIKFVDNKKIKSLVLLVVANFAVWTLMGLWHGVNYKYFIYGLYYFVIIATALLLSSFHIENFFISYDDDNGIIKCFKMIRTFLLVTIGMLMFRCPSIKEAYLIVKAIVTNLFVNINLSAIKLDNIDVTILFLAIFIWVIISVYDEYSGKKVIEDFVHLPIIYRWTLEITLIILVLIVGVYGPGFNSSSFIYGGF